MSVENTPTGKGTGRTFKALLVLSLALNLAVAGVVAGAVWRSGGWDGGGKRPPALSAFGAPYMLALPREDRRQILVKVRSDLRRGITDRSKRRAQYTEVLTALQAQPFDGSRLAQAVAVQAENTITVQKTAEAAWLELVSEMTDEERVAYARAVEEILRRGPRKRN